MRDLGCDARNCGERKVTMVEMGLGKLGKSYWVRASPERTGEGVVVAFGWMFSKRRHFEPYTRLYADSRCDTLVCHPNVMNLWFPSRADALAVQMLDELLQEVESKPRPIVFATFSGGAKACLFKIFQILQAGSKEASSPHAGKYDPVKACVRGQIHDSSPIEFVSHLGARFAVYSISQKLGRSVYGLPAVSQAVANILDALFLPKFELQREEFWCTLKESAKLGPLLILCCTNDDLAPFDFINKFATVARESGCAVDLVVWDASDHVGHLRNFRNEYQAAVKRFLDQRLQHAIETSSKETSPVQTEVESHVPIEDSETESGTPPPRCTSANSAQLVNAQEAWAHSRNLFLSSKL